MLKDACLGITTDCIVNICNSKGKNLQEQFLYCIDLSLLKMSKKYNFEYNVEIKKIFFEKIIYNNYIFSKDILKEIFDSMIDLEIDDKFIIEWLNEVDIIIVENKLDILKDYILLKNTKQENTNLIYPLILTAKPPLPPEEYIDRNEEKIILEKLKKVKKLVLVNGIGGIGKSTVCRRVFHSVDNRPLAWVVYNGKNLLDDFKKQLLYPKDDRDWEKKFIKFIEQDIDENGIIFIDNLNATEEEEKYLSKLSNAKCSIVCTSRIEKFSHYEVVPIDYFDEYKCIELFNKYYQKKCDEEYIGEIIRRAGNHTLVIEILAKIANAENYSLEELYYELVNKGFDLEGIASVENKEDTLIGHLCRTFNFDKLNDTHKMILYCLAILPVQWIPYGIKKWLSLSNNFNINYLVKHAWFESSEKGYYMHPVVKEVVKRKIILEKTIILSLLKGIVDDISYNENPDYDKSKMLISFVESILNFIQDEKGEIVTQAFYNISMLYGQFGEYINGKKYIDMCIEYEEENHNSVELLAAAYNHRGYINFYCFKDKEAEKDYLKAYKMRQGLKNNKNIAATASNLALLYKTMWLEIKDEDLRKNSKYLVLAEEYQKKAIEEFEKIFRGKLHPNLASAYNNMAGIYHSMKKYDEAIYYYRKAETIRVKIITDIFPGDLSVTYKGICDCYIDLSINIESETKKIIYYKIALVNLNKCIKIRKKEIEKGNQKWDVNNLFSLQQELKENITKLRNKKNTNS